MRVALGGSAIGDPGETPIFANWLQKREGDPSGPPAPTLQVSVVAGPATPDSCDWLNKKSRGSQRDTSGLRPPRLTDFRQCRRLSRNSAISNPGRASQKMTATKSRLASGAPFTRERSKVRSLVRPPRKPLFYWAFCNSGNEAFGSYRQNRAETRHLDPWKIRGKNGQMLLVRSLMKTVRPDTEFIGGRAFPSGATIHHKASAARSGFYDRQKDVRCGTRLCRRRANRRAASAPVDTCRFLIVLGPLIIEAVETGLVALNRSDAASRVGSALLAFVEQRLGRSCHKLRSLRTGPKKRKATLHHLAPILQESVVAGARNTDSYD